MKSGRRWVTVGDVTDRYGSDGAELVDAMWDGGFLDGAPQPPEQGRVAVTIEGLEFRGFDRVAGAMYRRIGRYIFTAGAVPIIALVALGGFVCFVVQARAGRPMTVGAASPVLAFFVLRVLGFGAVFLHETGHAVVTKHAGRRVGRVGAGFYWGALTFYVDASDTMFCERRTRMLQAAAGTIVDLVISGLAATAALMGGDAGWATVLREVAVLGYLAVLIDSTPLLELDGYWFLADALDRPALADDSRHALHQLVRRRPANRRLAAYRILSVAFGSVILVVSLGSWWALFGDLFHNLWDGSIAYKTLAVLLVLPNVAVLFHLALRVAQTVHARLRPTGSDPATQELGVDA